MVVGAIFQDRYKIIRVLGEGGVGKVYLAENVKLKTYWAIKEIDKRKSSDFDLLAEPNILKKLSHPSLPRIFDIVETDEYLYIIEDYVEGVSLDKALKEDGSYPEFMVVDWAKQLCDVLIYLHNLKPNPIIYRDMKPSNIIVNSDGKVKLIDFGIAREYKEEATADTTIIGTRGYAAPEQYGKSQSDARTDIYSLGVTLYHLLTGKSPNEPPYEIVPVRQINKKLSAGIERIIIKCTQPDPEKRYQSAKSLLYDLENINMYNKEARRRRVFLQLRIAFYAFMITGGIICSYFGSVQMGVEKEERYRDVLSSADAFFNNGDYEQSVAMYKEANSMFPDRVSGYLGIARTYIKNAEYEKCIDYIENEAGAAVPDMMADPEANYILGNAWYELKNYDRAVAYYQKAVSLSNDVEAYWRDLGVAMARTGKLDQAGSILQKMIEKNMSSEATQYLHAEILYKQGKYDESLDKFFNVINMEPEQQLLRRAYIVAGEIIRDYGALVEGSYKRGIGMLLTADGKLKEKNDLIITELIAELYYLQADTESDKTAREECYQRSAEYFKKLINMGYSRPYIFRNIAIIYQNLEDYKNAEEWLTEMEKRYPDNIDVYIQFAFLYAEMQQKKENEHRDYNKVLEYYEKAVQCAQGNESIPELVPLKKLIDELREKNWIQ